ncbi:MAG: hypothetical protein FJX67_05745 [Alphaproteobacteria bacterium]|nr:hypothetical protein [Alphaproteobacteria bacterium]
MAFARVGEEFPVNVFTSSNQERPVAVPLSGGRYLVVWQSGTQDGSGNGIYGRIQTAGDPLSGVESGSTRRRTATRRRRR